ncbi:AsmA family protein [Lysobacter humi (ex Lee et al. 2017)]
MTAGDDDLDLRAPQRRSRRRVVLLVVVLIIGAIAGLARWASRPEQVARLVLAQTGRALGLEITAAGVTDYTLRGRPQLVLRDVVAKRPGDGTAVLRAKRILLALPWTTLRSRGRDLVVHRVELDRPEIDLAALQRWLATRPKSTESRVPRLTDGFVVRGGSLVADGWQLEGVDLDVPQLAPDRPLRVHAAGRVVAGTTRIPFDVRATVMRPKAGAGLGVVGGVTVERPDWRLPMHVRLSGRPQLDRQLTLHGLRLGARAHYAKAATRLPFAFGLAGRARFEDGLVLEPIGIALRQGRELPDLDATGRITWSRALTIEADGALARWPSRWPALPEPLGRPRGPLPMHLAYTGPIDFSGRTDLELRDRRSVFDGAFRLPDVLEWIDAPPGGTPIPPIAGRVSTPRLEIPGATLEGVEVTVTP